MNRRLLVLVLVSALLAPVTAFAQASLAGQVRDSSGAVLPGAVVEASSPTLIEGARTALTDGEGRYQIVDLHPGTYVVTVTLTGFTTVRRDHVPLAGTATTAMNVSMHVGPISQTVTVGADATELDLRTTTRQSHLTDEIVTAVPTARNSFALGVLIPGVVLATGSLANQDVGGALGPTTLALGVHGSRMSDQRQTMNGVALSTMVAGGWGGGAVPNATGTAEFAIDTAAVDATLATGGVRINFIPKDGGNRIAGTVFGSYATERFQSAGARQVDNGPLVRLNNVRKNGDFNPGFGGPIVRSKLWFYLSGRYQLADLYVPGMYHNKNANNPNAFTYEPDLSRPATSPREFQAYMGRFTWQASPRQKLGLTVDWESNCFCPNGVTALRSPEAATDRRFPLQRFVQLDWRSAVGSRVLIEASGIHRVERWGEMHLQTGRGGNISSLVPGITGIVDLATGRTFRAAAEALFPGSPPYNNSWNENVHYRAALSYITGSHLFKVGFNNASGYHDNLWYGANPYFYNFFDGVPSSITLQAAPYISKVEVDRDLGIFAQDKWTTGRWTLSGGIRYDNFKNSFPPQTLGPTPLFPTRNVTFDRIDNINWHDITPELGATYDLLGNGKTAFKVTLNKYLLGYGTLAFLENGLSSNPNPILSLVNNTTRGWTDANRNFTPECDLANPAANGECGPWANPNFGSIVPLTTYDPNLLNGWNKRQFNWEFSAGIQHELVSGLLLDVSYFRRWYGNFQITIDRGVKPSDFDRFTFAVPADSRLPNAGSTLTALDLRNAFVPQDLFQTLARDHDVTMLEHWNGVDITINGRLGNRLVAQGGVSTGRTSVDSCGLVNRFPENSHTFFGAPTRLPFFAATPLEYCKWDDGVVAQLKGFASYTIPKLDVLLAGTVQSLPGDIISANYFSFDAGTLGRPFGSSFIAPFRAFQIVEPGAMRGERLNQVDVRVAKVFRISRTRTQINFDLFNLLNANTILAYNAAYSPPGIPVWLQPTVPPFGSTAVQSARFFKIGAQFDF